MSIKYYHLAKGEELPEEFCAVRDMGGEPSEYVFYVPETENAKLREFAADLWSFTKAACKKYPRLFDPVAGGITVQTNPIDSFEQRFHEVMGVGLDGDQV